MSTRIKYFAIAFFLLLFLMALTTLVFYSFDSLFPNFFKLSKCTGNAKCISSTVLRVIDGDTIELSRGEIIRFSLVNTPEKKEDGWGSATNFTKSLCPGGIEVLVDEDDKQKSGSYGRIIGLVYCNSTNVNEALLQSGFAVIETKYCKKSEFSNSGWAKKYGC